MAKLEKMQLPQQMSHKVIGSVSHQVSMCAYSHVFGSKLQELLVNSFHCKPAVTAGLSGCQDITDALSQQASACHT